MPRISIQAAKSKGRKLQQWVRDAILKLIPALSLDDVKSCPMGSQGADIMLSSAAQTAFPFDVECKARANGFTPLYDALEQADRKRGLTPIAVVKQDRRDPLVVMRATDWFKLVEARLP